MEKNKNVSFIGPHLPHEVHLQILHKLPLKSLIKFSCVSKLWLNSITNDKGFNKSHFLESKKKPVLILTSEILEYHRTNEFYYIEKVDHGNSSIDMQLRQIPPLKDRYLEGHCNGLVCFSGQSLEAFNNWMQFLLEIWNPTRRERLFLRSRFEFQGRYEKKTIYPRIFRVRFGYDPWNDEYKVMCIVSYVDKYDEYQGHKYFIYTLGSSSSSTQPWREIKNPPPRELHPITFYDDPPGNTPPVFCHETLFWNMRKEKEEKDDDEEQEDEEEEEEQEEKEAAANYGDLVSFDFHDEQFQVIKLPKDDEEFVKEYSKGDFSQLEYKGCFCLAHVKNFDGSNGSVELYILKDKVKQVWAAKETISFNIPTTAACNLPPWSYDLSNKERLALFSTRVVCFSDQIVLYRRRDNGIIQVYNVHSKDLKEVRHPSEELYLCNYHISSHVENSLSLKTFERNTWPPFSREQLEHFSARCFKVDDRY